MSESERGQGKFNRDGVAFLGFRMPGSPSMLMTPNVGVPDARQEIVANNPLVMPPHESLCPFEQCSLPQVIDSGYGRRVGAKLSDRFIVEFQKNNVELS